MIITNNMAHVHYIGNVRLLPGSNVVADGSVNLEHPIIKAMIENGDFDVETEITEKVAAKAIDEANTQATVEEIVKAAPKASKKVKEKADKKKADLDAFDAKVKAEIEAERKKKEED